MSELEQLLARVERGEVGYFLDESIHIALGEPEPGMFDPPEPDGGSVDHSDAGSIWKINRTTKSGFSSLAMPKYTASIDAALALVERVLGKHWLYEIKSGIEKRCILWMLETDYDDQGAPTGWHADSVPLAILAALLRALIARTLIGEREG